MKIDYKNIAYNTLPGAFGLGFVVFFVVYFLPSDQHQEILYTGLAFFGIPLVFWGALAYHARHSRTGSSGGKRDTDGPDGADGDEDSHSDHDSDGGGGGGGGGGDCGD